MTQDSNGEHRHVEEETPTLRASDGSRTALSRDILSFRLPIRWRLTIWYAGSLCLLLVGFSVLVWTMTNSWLLSQADLELIEELAELQESIDSSNDESALRRNVDVWSQLHEPYGFDFEIRTEAGKLLMQSRRLADAGETLNIAAAPDTVQSRHFHELGRLRVKQTPITILGRRHQLWIAVSEVEQRRLLDRLAMVLLTAGVVVMVGAAGGGYFLSRRALRPVDEITETAALISAHRLSQRITVANPHDELGRLAQTLNNMLDRLDQSFAELKRFTADAAHELRTPLTLLRNELEVCLRKRRSAEDYELTVRSVLDDTQRMCRLAEQLLVLARGDASSPPVASDPVPLAALLTDVVSQFEANVCPADVTIELDRDLKCVLSEDEAVGSSAVNGVAISGDCLRLRRLFLNLLENSVKHTSSGGQIRIHTRTFDSTVLVTVEDSGCGISPKHLPHIFDRFYRVDDSRASTTGGTGLGLAICRSIVEAHGGTIRIASELGRGTEVAVSLPLFDGLKDESPEMADQFGLVVSLRSTSG